MTFHLAGRCPVAPSSHDHGRPPSRQRYETLPRVEYRYAMPRPVASLSIRLLGPLEVVVAGRPIVVDTRKALAIVALVAAEGRPFARDELAAMFWPDADDEAARGALRRTLSALRSALGDAGFEIGRTQVAVDFAVTGVDLADFERLAGSLAFADLEGAAAPRGAGAVRRGPGGRVGADSEGGCAGARRDGCTGRQYGSLPVRRARPRARDDDVGLARLRARRTGGPARGRGRHRQDAAG